MKNLGWAIVIVISVYAFMSTNTKSSANAISSITSYSNDETFLSIVRQEPKVREALITTARVLYVSVIDDGTRRDGYASYLCELVRENRANISRVKVVKVNSTNDPNKDNAYGVLLGESWCK